MAIAILGERKWKEAEFQAKETGRDVLEIYKEMGGRYVEGTNAEIEGMYKYHGIFDEEEVPSEPEKPAKKAYKKKKK